jgi:phosphate transport system permease protein
MGFINKENVKKRMGIRVAFNVFAKFLFILATSFSLLVLGILLYRILSEGMPYLSLDFITNFASRMPERAGIWAALIGTVWVMAVTAPVSFILGVGTAIYLEEYAKKNGFSKFIQVNIANLAGVPSIVFGLLGLTIFVRVAGLGSSVLAGGLTMSLLILPVIVVASQEAIRTVPRDIREASFGMGATKWQTIRRIVFPAALPGILTGTILALSRAVGETAPLLVVGALAYVAFTPESLFSSFTVLPIQLYNWTSRPQEEFHMLAASGIIILMIILLIMNSIAVYIRNKFQKRF